MDKAQKIVKAIEEDLTDRRGLRQEWEDIDEGRKNEIRETWAEIVREELGKETVSSQATCSYRVAQSPTAQGLQMIVNQLLLAGFRPLGGISVVLTQTMHEEPLLLHTQAMV